TGRAWCVGLLAREQGARVPGRLVASSKSWLCHAAVDRTAPILPWGAGDEVPKVSPVEASARTLTHLREAWDASFPAPLAEQDVVLTVPASFDEVARELTLAAARAAGLPEVVMLEEPQAAFYAWLAANQADWRARVAAHPLVLVVDVGGGTTDLSLIAARTSRGELGLERVAVGEHLLLGGDNIDLARQRVAAGQVDLPLARPDALLFNGGALEPEAVRARLCDVVASWHGGRRPAVLEGESLQLAVARGAAYFGLARRGLGVRIGGGAARTYYLGLGDGRALCLVPRGM